MPEVGILFLIHTSAILCAIIISECLNARGGHFVFNTLILPHFFDFLSVDRDQEDKNKIYNSPFRLYVPKHFLRTPPFFRFNNLPFFGEGTQFI